MFTAEQIKNAHAQVRSGADFPAYVRAIKTMGVKTYETSVADGRTVFRGDGEAGAEWPPKYGPLEIAEQADASAFTRGLKEHQQGLSDYRGFIGLCAATGIQKWVVDTLALTCTYYDRVGGVVLVERIP